ncbi:hypothetical protein [Amylibacter sp. SFDW26]|nr:hypothetical protein [Amylibacter sp. SFDW26]
MSTKLIAATLLVAFGISACAQQQQQEPEAPVEIVAETPTQKY